jgi:hypothetical protein
MKATLPTWRSASSAPWPRKLRYYEVRQPIDTGKLGKMRSGSSSQSRWVQF